MHKNETEFPRWFARWSSLQGVLIFYAAYGALHGVITRAAGPALALDDVKLNIVTQSLQGGYLLENPPLFEWLLIAVQNFAGPTAVSFVIVKYGLLVASGGFTYLAAKEILSNRQWAGAAALSLLAFYQIGWNYHQAFTHTTVLIASTSLLWWSVLKLLRTRSIADYCLFGAAIGLGLLSKYSFAGVIAALVVALLARESGRNLLFNWRIGAALGLGAIIVSPHLFWILSDNASLAERAGEHLLGGEAPHWRRAVSGLGAALWAGASFFLPFLLIAAMFFGRAVWRPHTENPLALFARDAVLAGGAGIAAAIVIFGIDNIQERYLIAFVYPALFWLMAAIRDSRPTLAARQRFLFATMAIVALFGALRVAQTAVAGPPFCSNCRQWVPYAALGEALEQFNYQGGTLVGFEDHTAGNLRRMFPDERVISSHMPFYTPPGGAMGDPCLFVWSDDLGPPIPERVRTALDPATTTELIAEWRHPFRPAGWRKTIWTIAALDHDPALEIEICRPGR